MLGLPALLSRRRVIMWLLFGIPSGGGLLGWAMSLFLPQPRQPGPRPIEECTSERVRLMFAGFAMAGEPATDLSVPAEVFVQNGNERLSIFRGQYTLHDRRLFVRPEQFAKLGYHVRFDHKTGILLLRYQNEPACIAVSSRTRRVVAFWSDESWQFDVWWYDWTGVGSKVVGKPEICSAWAECPAIADPMSASRDLIIPLRVLAGAVRADPKRDVSIVPGPNKKRPIWESEITLRVPDPIKDVVTGETLYEPYWPAPNDLRRRLGIP